MCQVAGVSVIRREDVDTHPGMTHVVSRYGDTRPSMTRYVMSITYTCHIEMTHKKMTPIGDGIIVSHSWVARPAAVGMCQDRVTHPARQVNKRVSHYVDAGQEGSIRVST